MGFECPDLTLPDFGCLDRAQTKQITYSTENLVKLRSAENILDENILAQNILGTGKKKLPNSALFSIQMCFLILSILMIS